MTGRRSPLLQVFHAEWREDHGTPPPRDECRNGERPCRFVRCPSHLWFVDERDSVGRPRTSARPRSARNRKERSRLVASTEFSCGADIFEAAERAGTALTNMEIGVLLGMTAEGARQILQRGLKKLREAHGEALAGEERALVDPPRPAAPLVVIRRRATP